MQDTWEQNQADRKQRQEEYRQTIAEQGFPDEASYRGAVMMPSEIKEKEQQLMAYRESLKEAAGRIASLEEQLKGKNPVDPVAYTHLDVYKRQVLMYLVCSMESPIFSRKCRMCTVIVLFFRL